MSGHTVAVGGQRPCAYTEGGAPSCITGRCIPSGDRERAAALLRAKIWGIDGDERHRDELAPGDLALIYVATTEGGFISRAKLATAVHDWTPSEADAYPGDSSSGVVLSHVEEWDPAVPMDAAVQRIERRRRTR